MRCKVQRNLGLVSITLRVCITNTYLVCKLHVDVKLSLDMKDTLHEKIVKAAKTNQRSMAAEIRFQLIKIYEWEKI